jgi:hypothetical protein
MSAAIDMQYLAGDEACAFKIEHRLDDFLDLAHAAHRLEIRQGGIGVLIVPGETAFIRMPRSAYSMASAFVTAFSPPLVSEARAAGAPLNGWSTRLVVMPTIWPPPCFSICATASCVTWKKPARLTEIMFVKSATV